MLMIVQWIIWGLGVYFVMGLFFASAFVLGGVDRISPASRGSGWAFRLLIIPGSAVFWPWLAVLWIRPAARPQRTVEIEQAACDRSPVDPEAETRP